MGSELCTRGRILDIGRRCPCSVAQIFGGDVVQLERNQGGTPVCVRAEIGGICLMLVRRADTDLQFMNCELQVAFWSVEQRRQTCDLGGLGSSLCTGNNSATLQQLVLSNFITLEVFPLPFVNFKAPIEAVKGFLIQSLCSLLC
ncbi:hypothetical protein GOP47_0030755 [Adiantum capillus-veneris]|nr:hypothetical protein GOP47_0030755 [Adiantum capillus-veneris]